MRARQKKITAYKSIVATLPFLLYMAPLALLLIFNAVFPAPVTFFLYMLKEIFGPIGTQIVLSGIAIAFGSFIMNLSDQTHKKNFVKREAATLKKEKSNALEYINEFLDEFLKIDLIEVIDEKKHHLKNVLVFNYAQ